MTKPLIVVIPHQLGLGGAKRRLEAGLARVKDALGDRLTLVDHRWTGDRLDVAIRAMGQSVTAALLVEEGSVRVEVELPWMLALLAGKAKSLIEKEGNRLLIPKK